jgi:hypothetical protein
MTLIMLKTYDVRNAAISSKILQIIQTKQQDHCIWCCYGGNCDGTGVAIEVIMGAVMEWGWKKWWWCGSAVAGFIIFAPYSGLHKKYHLILENYFWV